MATWFCGACGTEYSVGAPRCPQCLAVDPIRPEAQLAKENEMAKITVHGGPSNVDAEPGEPGHVEPADDGTQEPDVVTEDTDEVSEQPEPVDYNTFNVTDLRAELAERHLTVSGTKDELVARLVEDDKARADEAELDSAE